MKMDNTKVECWSCEDHQTIYVKGSLISEFCEETDLMFPYTHTPPKWCPKLNNATEDRLLNRLEDVKRRIDQEYHNIELNEVYIRYLSGWMDAIEWTLGVMRSED